MHCDLWTAPISCVSGNNLIIVDDYIKYRWTFPLVLKSDVHAIFRSFHALVRTHFHRTIATFQCENGREFDNASNRDFFLPFGTTMRFSCPYTSSQNGTAERAIRSTNDVVRTLLIQANMPPKYWADALSTATHLLNLRPTKTLL